MWQGLSSRAREREREGDEEFLFTLRKSICRKQKVVERNDDAEVRFFLAFIFPTECSAGYSNENCVDVREFWVQKRSRREKREEKGRCELAADLMISAEKRKNLRRPCFPHSFSLSLSLNPDDSTSSRSTENPKTLFITAAVSFDVSAELPRRRGAPRRPPPPAGPPPSRSLCSLRLRLCPRSSPSLFFAAAAASPPSRRSQPRRAEVVGRRRAPR